VSNDQNANLLRAETTADLHVDDEDLEDCRMICMDSFAIIAGG
jgi:hypothetical protein